MSAYDKLFDVKVEKAALKLAVAYEDLSLPKARRIARLVLLVASQVEEDK